MSNNWEEALTKSLLKDQKSTRRWKNIRCLVWMLVLLLYAVLIFSPSTDQSSSKDSGPYVSLVRITGAIMPNSANSAHSLYPGLKKAFADSKSKGVILDINSPGGSAVQSSIIHDQILHLKKKYKKKVIVVGEDSLASGAYMIAVAADKIYVNDATVTGSIGVVASSFGFTDLMKKAGVSRRSFTAGKFKGRLDPFEPLDAADTVKMHAVLEDIHQHFIDMVKTGRGKRLALNNPNLFTGDFWVGDHAVKLGLVDGIGNLDDVMQNQFKVTRYKNYSKHPPLLSLLLGNVREELSLFIASTLHTQTIG